MKREEHIKHKGRIFIGIVKLPYIPYTTVPYIPFTAVAYTAVSCMKLDGNVQWYYKIRGKGSK